MAYFASGEGISRTSMPGLSPPTWLLFRIMIISTRREHSQHINWDESLIITYFVKRCWWIYWKKRVTFFYIYNEVINTSTILNQFVSLLDEIAALFSIQRAKWKSVQESQQTDYNLVVQIQQVLQTKWQKHLKSLSKMSNVSISLIELISLFCLWNWSKLDAFVVAGWLKAEMMLTMTSSKFTLCYKT